MNFTTAPIRVLRVIVQILIGLMPVGQAVGQNNEARVVTYLNHQQEVTVTGEVVKEYSDGSLLLLVPDGRLLTIHGTEILESQPSLQPFLSASVDEMIESLNAELGQEFKYHRSKNYLIAYNTHQAYAEWVGQLFERLHRGFQNYWSARRMDLNDPRFPLVAIVFSNKSSYLTYAERDVGESASSMYGYYNLNTNRMVMYDLTGVDGLVPKGQRLSSHALINQVLSQPQSERTVATLVHEAVHQLAYNSGLQVRLADNPIWLSEGLAMYFESPDLRSPQGWKMGSVNYHNLRLFAQYSGRRGNDSIETLIRDDERFRSAETVVDAYPESWALTYFLMKARGKQFVEYLREIGKLEPLDEAESEKRLLLFQKHFGDLDKLNRDFMNYLRKVR